MREEGGWDEAWESRKRQIFKVQLEGLLAKRVSFPLNLLGRADIRHFTDMLGTSGQEAEGVPARKPLFLP